MSANYVGQKLSKFEYFQCAQYRDSTHFNKEFYERTMSKQLWAKNVEIQAFSVYYNIERLIPWKNADTSS